MVISMKTIRMCALSILVATSAAYAEQPKVKLTVNDQNGQPISAVKPGSIVQVKVTIASSIRERPEVSVDGLEQFRRLGTSSSSHVTMINGSLSAERTYQYTVRAESPGSFVIGPARVRVEHEEGSSETVQLHVDAAAAPVRPNQTSAPMQSRTYNREQQASADQDDEPAVIVELKPDKKSTYERQPLDISLKLWLSRGVQCPHGVALPENPKSTWQIKHIGETRQSSEMRGSKVYQLIEQRFRLTPKTAGSLTFPAIQVPCLVPLNTSRFFNIFGPRLEEKVFSSEPFTIEVKKLPAHPVPADAVGSFDRISAKIDRNQARVGEGLIYKLIVEGQTDEPSVGAWDAELVATPKLKLPDGLTSYPSQQEFKQISPHSWQKSFEYVVQATRQGTFTIPPQLFVYFEPHTEQYYTLRSESVPVTIAALSKQKEDTGIAGKQDEKKVAEQQADVLKQPVEQALNDTHSNILIKLIIFFLSLLAVVFIYKRVRAWRAQRMESAPYRLAFARAYRELERLKQSRDVSGLHSLITQLFAARAQVPAPMVTQLWMREYLMHHGMPERDVNDWIREVEYLQRFAFYEHGMGDAQIFQRVERWLHELEKWI